MINIKGLNGNQLKIIACISMLLDHIGMLLLPEIAVFRWLGRIAFPIFAFFIAEGCKYTHNKYKYLGLMLGLGLIMMAVQFIATGSTYTNVLITFSLSVVLIYALQYLKKLFTRQDIRTEIKSLLLVGYIVIVLAVMFFAEIIHTDYGAFGVLLALFFSLPDTSNINVGENIKKYDNIYIKLALGTIIMIVLTILNEWYQIFSLFAVLLLLCYNGERGSKKLKYLFYIFYPLHFVVLYGIQMLIMM